MQYPGPDPVADFATVSRRWSSLSIVALLALAACGNASSAGAPTTSPNTEAPTTAVATTAAVTTTAASLDTLLSPDTEAPDSTVGTSAASTETLPKPEDPPPPDLVVPRSQIGRIELPDIKIDQPLYEGVSLPTLNKGPGHWPGSAMPGQLGNVVIAGHRVSHNHPFRDIDKLKPGNQVVFTFQGGRYVYLVRETKIVYPDALWIVEQTPSKTATLFACHPKGSTKQRIVVFLDYAPDLSTPAA